jgi:hypothetical protein
VTGGIGAAFLGHALTRFAIFISTGHAGQVTPSVAYEQELGEEDRKVTPVGWEVVGDREPGGTRGVQ